MNANISLILKNKKYSLHTYLHSERLDSQVYKIRQDLKRLDLTNKYLDHYVYFLMRLSNRAMQLH